VLINTLLSWGIAEKLLRCRRRVKKTDFESFHLFATARNELCPAQSPERAAGGEIVRAAPIFALFPLHALRFSTIFHGLDNFP